MSDASNPQTDREFMMEMKGELSRLSDVISRLDRTLIEIETDRLKSIDTKIFDIQTWRSQMDGVWKAVVAAGLILSIAAMIVAIVGALK